MLKSPLFWTIVASAIAFISVLVGAGNWIWPDFWRPDPRSAWIASEFHTGKIPPEYVVNVGNNLRIRSKRPKLLVITVKGEPLLALHYTSQTVLFWKRMKFILELHLRDKNGVAVADAEGGTWRVYEGTHSKLEKSSSHLEVWDKFRDAFISIKFENPKELTLLGKLYWKGHIFLLNDEDGLYSPTVPFGMKNLTMKFGGEALGLLNVE